jgi:hypothetical protein
MAKPQTDEFKNGMLFNGMRMHEGNPQRFKLFLRRNYQSARNDVAGRGPIATSGDAVSPIDTLWLTVY